MKKSPFKKYSLHLYHYNTQNTQKNQCIFFSNEYFFENFCLERFPPGRGRKIGLPNSALKTDQRSKKPPELLQRRFEYVF